MPFVHYMRYEEIPAPKRGVAAAGGDLVSIEPFGVAALVGLAPAKENVGAAGAENPEPVEAAKKGQCIISLKIQNFCNLTRFIGGSSSERAGERSSRRLGAAECAREGGRLRFGAGGCSAECKRGLLRFGSVI